MKKCFVISPIKKGLVYEKFLRRFQSIIQPAVEGLQVNGEKVFECIRADESPKSGSIISDVVKHLFESDVVIADLTASNPNVYYELGIRHALRCRTLLIAEEGTVLPFDIGWERVVFYKDIVGSESQSIDKIRRTLLHLTTDDEVQDSPVLHALPVIEESALRRFPVPRSLGWELTVSREIKTPLDGRWLEILDRYENRKKVRHYSVFTFKYDVHGHGHPFSMSGRSYHSNGEDHSHWRTPYIRIEESKQVTSVEYIYHATIPEVAPRRGYGISQFWGRVPGELTLGRGYYHAVELRRPYYCYYRLERIENDVFSQFASERDFVLSLGKKYGSVPTGSDR